MTLNIRNATFGQHPYFDNSTPDFDPVGETYNHQESSLPTLNSGGKAISYGSSTGARRYGICIRRYVYEYVSINNTFNYYKTYKGVRNFEQPDSVIDVGELNSRSLIHSTETAVIEPTFITQTILKSLFSFPSNSDYFFIEGVHSRRGGEIQGYQDPLPVAPNYFKIYRYGKITQNNIVLVYKNNNIERRESNA